MYMLAMYFTYLLTWLTCVYFTEGIGLYSLEYNYRYQLQSRYLRSSIPKIKVENRTIEQPLDHFNKSDIRTWQMRYLEGLEFWKTGGPVYLFIGGESKLDSQHIQSRLIRELANETNGALYSSEHRYYGDSKPFPDLDAKNMAYLSSRQALADIAKLLKEIKSLPQYNNSKIVVVGGSYAGNLAAWMKLLYSDLVDAAIASSAPVLAKKDFYEYLEIVGQDFKQHGSPECYEEIEAKFKRFDDLLQTKAGIEQLKSEKNICNETDMTALRNKQLFFSLQIDIYAAIAQYGSPHSIKSFCINQIYNIHKIPYSIFEMDFQLNKRSCRNYDIDAYIDIIKSYDTFPWIYQTCNEFGYYQTTSSDNQPFTKNIPLDFYLSLCSKMFGPEFNEARVDKGIQIINKMYGGLKPNITQVVFVNGDLDPWHSLGVLEDLSEEAPAKLVNGTSHCEDLNYSPEHEQMFQTVLYVKRRVKSWIAANRA